MHLHILHRIRLLGTMTGVFAADSEGDWGYPANMSPGGAEPSPSKMIELVPCVPEEDPTWATRNMKGSSLTHDFFGCSFHVKHPNRFGPARDLVRRLVEYLELLEKAFVGPALMCEPRVQHKPVMSLLGVWAYGLDHVEGSRRI